MNQYIEMNTYRWVVTCYYNGDVNEWCPVREFPRAIEADLSCQTDGYGVQVCDPGDYDYHEVSDNYRICTYTGTQPWRMGYSWGIERVQLK